MSSIEIHLKAPICDCCRHILQFQYVREDSLDEEYTRGAPLYMYTTLWVPSNSTDCEPMCSFIMFTRVLWRTLMKGSWSLLIELTQISISTKKKKAKLHYSGSKDCTNEQMFRSVLFSGLRDQFVVCHYCHNPSDKCK